MAKPFGELRRRLESTPEGKAALKRESKRLADILADLGYDSRERLENITPVSRPHANSTSAFGRGARGQASRGDAAQAADASLAGGPARREHPAEPPREESE